MRCCFCLCAVAMVSSVALAEPWQGGVREELWPEGRIPDFQEHQACVMVDEPKVKGKSQERSRMPYLEWFAPPADPNGGCMILIPGGAYEYCGGIDRFRLWRDRFTELGYQTVALVYRAPRPKGGLPCHQSAWEDGQRAVRLVRSQAKVRGYDPEKIGAIGMSAGGHLVTMLATSALTDAYPRVDALDAVPCHLNWGIANAPAYNTANSAAGIPYHIDGTVNEWPKASPFFKFDAKTCPVSFHHGAVDGYTPNGSTQCYRELRKRKIPAELHLYADCGHDAIGLERAVEFMRQMNFDGRLGSEVDRCAVTGAYTAERIREELWPAGKIPDAQANQTNAPTLTWFVPKTLKTKAIQIVFPGGGYESCDVIGEGLPVAEYLNRKGMTAVIVDYRCPRPQDKKLPKYWTAWVDARRAICKVRHTAAARGLDPGRIGTMGFSAGGHLTLLTGLSSTFYLYHPVDDADREPCRVQWACPISSAYALTDGIDAPNAQGGDSDDAVPVPEFLFDVDTPPMCFVHGDADRWSAMNSVKVWEKLRRIGVSCDLHTLAKRVQCFQMKASPGTGSYTWMDRVWDFLERKGFVEDAE